MVRMRKMLVHRTDNGGLASLVLAHGDHLRLPFVTLTVTVIMFTSLTLLLILDSIPDDQLLPAELGRNTCMSNGAGK